MNRSTSKRSHILNYFCCQYYPSQVTRPEWPLDETKQNSITCSNFPHQSDLAWVDNSAPKSFEKFLHNTYDYQRSVRYRMFALVRNKLRLQVGYHPRKMDSQFTENHKKPNFFYCTTDIFVDTILLKLIFKYPYKDWECFIFSCETLEYG